MDVGVSGPEGALGVHNQDLGPGGPGPLDGLMVVLGGDGGVAAPEDYAAALPASPHHATVGKGIPDHLGEVAHGAGADQVGATVEVQEAGGYVDGVGQEADGAHRDRQ